jgi:hypothetical protein
MECGIPTILLLNLAFGILDPGVRIKGLTEHLMQTKQPYRAKSFQTPLKQSKSALAASPEEQEEDAPRFRRSRWSILALFSRKRRRR